MTDARLRGEWLTAPAHDGLSDQAYRILHNALMHCAEQSSDGALTSRELRYLYPGPITPAWLDELEAAGFWEPTGDGYQLIGWSTTLGQSTAAEIAAYRERGRARQKRWRDKQTQRREENALAAGQDDGEAAEQAAPEGNTAPGEIEHPRAEAVTGAVTRYETVHVGTARHGSARPSPSRAQEGKRTRGRARGAPDLRVVDGRRVCPEGTHLPTSDGTCRNCEIRAEDLARETNRSTA